MVFRLKNNIIKKVLDTVIKLDVKLFWHYSVITRKLPLVEVNLVETHVAWLAVQLATSEVAIRCSWKEIL